MGCGCRKAAPAAGPVLGYRVVYPDGSMTPDDQLMLSANEAWREARRAGGGSVKRVVKSA